jgi:hypothetical protein
MRSRALIAVAVVLVTGGLTTAAPQPLSLFDTVSAALLGSEGSYLQFIGTAVLYIGFAYAVTLPYSERRDTWMQLELLRHGSNARWLTAAIRRALLPLLLFPAGLAVFSAAWYLALGGRTFTLPQAGLPAWMFQLVANGGLQLLVYVLILLSATIGTSNRAGGLAATAALFALALPRRQPIPALPVQLSGMTYAQNGWASALPATATLLIATVLATAAALLVMRRLQRTA